MTVDEAIREARADWPRITKCKECQKIAVKLAEEVERLREENERLRGEISCEFIHIANIDGLVMLRPMTAMVQKEGNSFVASCPAPVVNASGDTQDDAVEMLKDMIAWTFRLLTEKEDSLGEGPQQQLAVLRQFIGEHEHERTPPLSFREMATGEAEDLEAELAKITPQNADLLHMADRFPAPQEWYDE